MSLMDTLINIVAGLLGIAIGVSILGALYSYRDWLCKRGGGLERLMAPAVTVLGVLASTILGTILLLLKHIA